MESYRALTTIGAPGAPKAAVGDIIPLDETDAAELLAIGAVEVAGGEEGVAPAPTPAPAPVRSPAPAPPRKRAK